MHQYFSQFDCVNVPSALMSKRFGKSNLWTVFNCWWSTTDVFWMAHWTCMVSLGLTSACDAHRFFLEINIRLEVLENITYLGNASAFFWKKWPGGVFPPSHSICFVLFLFFYLFALIYCLWCKLVAPTPWVGLLGKSHKVSVVERVKILKNNWGSTSCETEKCRVPWVCTDFPQKPFFPIIREIISLLTFPHRQSAWLAVPETIRG